MHAESTVQVVTCFLLSQVKEMAESHDGSHYYNELPCNMNKDARTGKNVYEVNETH